jgi:2'-5' RNA ligase
MRLFVAAWPTDEVLSALAGAVRRSASPGLRWVPPAKWHVTLAFLGSVPDEEHEEIAAVLRSLGPATPPCVATLGPVTSVLGSSVLCVQVTGLDELASSIRRSTEPFGRPAERGPSFVGHLTLARARPGRSVPGAVAGVPVRSAWRVTEIRLVSSITEPDGARYAPTAVVALGG